VADPLLQALQVAAKAVDDAAPVEVEPESRSEDRSAQQRLRHLARHYASTEELDEVIALSARVELNQLQRRLHEPAMWRLIRVWQLRSELGLCDVVSERRFRCVADRPEAPRQEVRLVGCRCLDRATSVLTDAADPQEQVEPLARRLHREHLRAARLEASRGRRARARRKRRKLWAERRAGELLAAMRDDAGRLPNGTVPEANISRKQSSEFQKLAAVPAHDFQAAIDTVVEPEPAPPEPEPVPAAPSRQPDPITTTSTTSFTSHRLARRGRTSTSHVRSKDF
jgi:hypothetical protein